MSIFESPCKTFSISKRMRGSHVKKKNGFLGLQKRNTRACTNWHGQTLKTAWPDFFDHAWPTRFFKEKKSHGQAKKRTGKNKKTWAEITPCLLITTFQTKKSVRPKLKNLRAHTQNSRLNAKTHRPC